MKNYFRDSIRVAVSVSMESVYISLFVEDITNSIIEFTWELTWWDVESSEWKVWDMEKWIGSARLIKEDRNSFQLEFDDSKWYIKIYPPMSSLPEGVDVMTTFDSKGNFEVTIEKESERIESGNCKVGIRDQMLFVNLGDDVEYRIGMKLVEIKPH